LPQPGNYRRSFKNVNTDLKLKYPLVDWKRMAGIRDVIIHDYFGIDFEIIWDTIKTDIPVLKKIG
jgi:uncharacterized protein with HEPN domain